MSKRQDKWLCAAGLALFSLSLVVAFLSSRLGYGADWSAWPVPALAALSVVAGGVYVLVTAGGRRLLSTQRGVIFWVLLVGAAMRLVMMCSTPSLEDDFYRYLWDGAVLAHGFNPYAYPPGAVVSGSASVPPALQQLGAQAGVALSRLNHPHLTTIYPPVAQAAFALAHLMAPFSLTAWRLVLWCFDMATLAVLWVILRNLQLPAALLAVYWWNPLVVKEIFNSGHMDVIALPFVLGAVWLSLKGRVGGSLFALGLGVGAKLWPLALIPLLVRPWYRDPGKLAAGLGLLGLTLAALFLPVYGAGQGSLTGFLAYSRAWEMNDAIFKALNWGVGFTVGLAGSGGASSQLLTRLIMLALVAAWVGWLARRPWADGLDLCRKCLFALAALFLLSPAQFPWYFSMVAPFLVMYPQPSLVLLTALLPLYYLRYYFLAAGRVEWFDYGLVWLEYLPVCLLIIWEWRSGYRPATARLAERSTP